MTYTEEQLWDLLNQVYRMPYGSAQIALVEQVIAHADAQRLADLAFAARMQATTSYAYGGEPARSFVTFSWCLAEFDRNPTQWAGHQRTLLWHFKYMVSALTRFPEVPLERTFAVLDDMEGRWRATGHSMHAVHAYRHRVHRHVGDLVQAQDQYVRWCAAPRDDLSDCLGCDPSAKASWLASQNRDEEAVALGEPVLAGQLTCSEQPQGILTTLLKPYLRTGRLDEARDAHRRAYRAHRPNLADMGDIADHIEFCAITGNEARGVEILERHLGWLDRAPSPHAAMIFAAAGALVLRRAKEQGHEVRLHRPAHRDRPATDIAGEALREELTTLALDTAAKFDARNETDYQGRLVRELLDAEQLVDYLPLSPTARRRTDRPHWTPDGGSRPVGAETPAATEEPATSHGSMASDGSTVTPVAGSAPPDAAARVQFTVPDGLDPDELLDLVEELYRDYRAEDAHSALHAFDERFGAQELTALQRARRADGHGMDLATRGEFGEAEKVWRGASELYGQAGDRTGRDRTLARIGALLCQLGRPDEGLGLLCPATERLIADGPADRRYSAALRLADAYARQDRFEEALAALDRARSLLDLVPEERATRAAAEVTVERLWALRASGHLQEVLAGVDKAVELARAAGVAPLLVRAYVLLGGCREMTGDLIGAAAALEEAIAVTTEEGTRRWLRQTRANVLADTDRAGEVLDELVEAVAEATAAGDALAAANARQPLARAYANIGRLLDAAEVAEEWLGILLRHDGADPTPARYLLAAIYRDLGEPDQALTQLEAIKATCVEDGNLAGVAQIAEEIADLLDGLDRDVPAAESYLEAAQAHHDLGRPVDELRCRRRHAMLTLWGQGADAARAALAAADELAASLVTETPPDGPGAEGDAGKPGAQGAIHQDGHLTWERGMLHYDAARILRAANEHGEAIARARQSAAEFRSLGAGPQICGAEALLADLLLGDARAGEAEAAARRALAAAPEDADPGRIAALLTAALTAQGRHEEAAACRAKYGLESSAED